MKERAEATRPPSGRFEWLRRELVGALGGCLYHETPVLVQMGGAPMVWFERDEQGHALLNVRMLTTAGYESERLRIENNDFILRGTPIDCECPPSGRLMRIRYSNGDYLRLAFREYRSVKAAQHHFTHIPPAFIGTLDASWPLTFVEISMSAGGTGVHFGPTVTRLPGNNTIRGGLISRCAIGIAFG